MMVAIHQPIYLPYLGFLDKMRKSDIFVIYDDAQFNKREFHHRNKIRIYEGWKWLTVPVNKEEIPIKEIKIKNKRQKNEQHWSNLHFNDIYANYKSTPFFNLYEDELNKIYNKHYERLIDLNMNLIRFLMNAFGIETEIVFASEFNLTSRSSQKNLDLVQAVGGDRYFSGPAGRNYLDVALFKKNGIEVSFQDFKHPVYKQRYEGFEPNMAAIDALFNVGEIPIDG